MNNVEFGHVLNTREQLLKEAASLFLLDALMLHDVVEELATRGVLHDEVELLLSFDDLVEVDDVRVVHHL